MIKDPDFYIPPLMIFLEECNFLLSEKSYRIIKKLDEPMWKIFGILHKKQIIEKIQYDASKYEENYRVYCKIFFTKTKYLKLIFQFSKKGNLFKISFNKIILENLSNFSIFESNLRMVFLREIYQARSGIYLEIEFNDFLEELKEINQDCLDYRNLACDPNYDPFGIDFKIKFKRDLWMPLQVKGNKLFVEKHVARYPSIPLIITSSGESFSDREKKLFNLRDKYFAKVYPLVIY